MGLWISPLTLYGIAIYTVFMYGVSPWLQLFVKALDARVRPSPADVPEIFAVLIAAAKGGDIQAARLILERVLPPFNGIEQAVTIKLPADGTLTAKADAVLCAVAAGDLAPGQASQLIAALEAINAKP